MNRHSFIKTFGKLKPKQIGFFLCFFTCLLLRVETHGQTPAAPAIISQKTLGGSSNEILFSSYPTSDGGYIMGGQTSSSNGDVKGDRKGFSDGWIVKTDVSGTIVWQNNLAGARDDIITSVKETSDQGFIVLGYTSSTDGDFSLNHGGADVFVAKLTKTGSIEWIKCFGGTLDEKSGEIIASSDGGYVFTGGAKSFNGDLLSKSPIDMDAWVVKINATGMIDWQQLFNENYTDFCKAIKQLPNKNYVVVSNMGTTSGTNQKEDISVRILLPSGQEYSQRNYGGSSQDLAACIETTPDGGFVILGKSNSKDGTLTKNKGNFDVWLLKMNVNGSLQWQKTFDGSDVEGGIETNPFGSIKPTEDDGYIFTSSTNSKDGDISTIPWLGQARLWVVKLNCKQEIQWQKVLGGSGGDFGVFIEQKTDLSYFVSANTNSTNGDVLGNKGGQDFWLINLSKDNKLKPNFVVSGPLEFCEGNSIKLNADMSIGFNYQWQKDGINLPTETSPKITITKSGQYKVVITSKDCPKSKVDTSVFVKVTSNPALGLPTDTTFCKNPTQLRANNIVGATYQWSSGENTPTITPTSSGIYKLKVKVGGCEVDSSVNVKQSSAPSLTFKSQMEHCFEVNKSYNLVATTDLTLRFRWSPNNETSNNINISEAGTYTVKASNADGCITEKSVMMIQKCVSKIYAPNIFTPNTDGDNDIFWISAQDISDYELKIYNRWGEMVFMSGTETEGWDGNFRGKKAEEGHYSWQLTYRNSILPIEVLKHSGIVLLLR